MAKICPILNIGRTDKTLKCIGDECAFWGGSACIVVQFTDIILMLLTKVGDK